MKNLLLITSLIIGLLLIIGCKKEEPAVVEPSPDCNCDRVMSHTKFSIAGQPPTYFGDYVTINDCSGVQVNGSWSTNSGDTEPVNGECL